jgi:hypothetical protein
LFWPAAWLILAIMLGLSLTVALLQAAQATLALRYEGPVSRLLIAALCYAQPLVRSWRRYRTRLFTPYLPAAASCPPQGRGRMPLTGGQTAGYWSEDGCERTELLGVFIAYLLEHRMGTTIDSGWSDWDVEVHCHPWTRLQVRTADEDHGSGKRLVRVRYRLRLTRFARAVALVGLAAVGAATVLCPPSAAVGAGLLSGLLLGVWWRGARLAALAVEGLDRSARSLNMIRCTPGGQG